MRHISPDELPRKVRIEHAWIPMPDGVRLHARLWLPEDAGDSSRVPALLEYLPYRKDDWTAARDHERHPWYAGHGYASIRVDIRGTGDSEGVYTDEYSESELSDGEAVLDWIAAQPWSTGDVGMFGISWGGFNSLQLAARRPAPLKAIVTVCSTDDRYDNDVHYVGGSVLGVDMTAWAGAVFAFMTRPPDPIVVGDAWREMWQERLDGQSLPVATWLSHQTRDAYWKHGSVCEDYADIEVPVLAVGGWADPYHDTVLRLVENLPGQVKGLLGPWAHQYPDRADSPGPAIGFLQESLRWWDRWLKGEQNGVEDEADLRVFVEGYRPPRVRYDDVPGHWMGTTWPAPDVGTVEHRFTRAAVPVHDGWITVRTPQHNGVDSGRFFPFGNDTDLPPDQRGDDGRSVALDSDPLDEDLTLLGVVRTKLHIDSNQPRGQVIVRMCDVAPDGSSRLLARGVMNLSAREGPDRDVPWVPGRAETIDVPLTSVGVTVPAGHVLRFTVSTTYWPWVWPHAEPLSLRVDLRRSHAELPRLAPGRVPDADEITFEEPEQMAPLPAPAAPPTPPRTRPSREVRFDVDQDTWTLDVDPGYVPMKVLDDGLVYTEDSREVYRITGDDPTSALATSEWEVQLRRGDWHVRTTTRQEVTATAESFHIRARMTAETGGELVAERDWYVEVPRTVG